MPSPRSSVITVFFMVSPGSFRARSRSDPSSGRGACRRRRTAASASSACGVKSATNPPLPSGTVTADMQSVSRYTLRASAVSCATISLEEVVDRALHAVAGGLAGDDHGVGGEQRLEERGVPLRERLPVVARQHLGPQHRVVLGQRVAALDLHPRLRAAREGVEHARLVHDAGERVTVAAEQAVRRPQVELVLPGLLQLRAVVAHLLAAARGSCRRTATSPPPGSAAPRRARSARW